MLICSFKFQIPLVTLILQSHKIAQQHNIIQSRADKVNLSSFFQSVTKMMDRIRKFQILNTQIFSILNKYLTPADNSQQIIIVKELEPPPPPEIPDKGTEDETKDDTEDTQKSGDTGDEADYAEITDDVEQNNNEKDIDVQVLPSESESSENINLYQSLEHIAPDNDDDE